MTDEGLIEAIQRIRLEIQIQKNRLSSLEADFVERIATRGVPGYCIKERYGPRQWSADESIVRFMLGTFDIIGLKSPAQVEKSGVDPTVLKPLTTRTFIDRYIARVK